MRNFRVWRFGLIGTGSMAETMLQCFALNARAKVVSVASKDPSRARDFVARCGIDAAHLDIEAMLARNDVDAVYIANATPDHAETAGAAIAAGKAVLCEKPFAINAVQGAHLVEAATTHRRLLMEAQWTPFLPAYRELLRMVDARVLGEPLQLYSAFGQSLAPDSHARLFSGEGAGVLLDFGVYPIVLARQLLGPVVDVRAALISTAAGVDVQAALQLVHASGGQSQLAASLVAALPNRTTLSGSHGSVELDSPVMGAEWLTRRVSLPQGPRRRQNEGTAIMTRMVTALRRRHWVRSIKAKLPQGTRSAYPFGADRYSAQLDHFIKLLDVGALTSDVMPIETSLDVLRIIDLARANAARSGTFKEIP